MTVRSKLVVTVLVVGLAILAIYWFFLRGPTTEIGKLQAWFDSACESAGGMTERWTREPGGGEGWGGDFFADRYGTRFKRVLDAHGTELDSLACEYGGESMLFMQFAAPRYAARAASLSSGPPSCELKIAIFNGVGARDRVSQYCSRLGGEMTP